MAKLREKNWMINIFWGLAFLSSFWGLAWSVVNAGFSNFHYFTLQSNLLVLATTTAFLLCFQDKKWFKYLSAIALINIIITGIVFHVLLAEYIDGLHSHLLHTFTPILYVLFYFTSITNVLKTKQFYVMLIYPLVYFLIFLIIGAVTGYAPYDFMNVSISGVWPVIQLTIFMMMPAIIILSIILLYLKNLLESKIKG
jgi:hypothetical protein